MKGLGYYHNGLYDHAVAEFMQEFPNHEDGDTVSEALSLLGT
jgi:hypothetical protein